MRCKKNRVTLDNKTGLKLYITLDGKKVIGVLNFFNMIYGCFLSSFVGHGLAEKHVGNVLPENTHLRAVLQRCGFEEEGRAKNYLRINGVWKDHIHMVILNKTMA